MDWGHYERDYAAGHPDRAPRLDRETWDGMARPDAEITFPYTHLANQGSPPPAF
jgi:hypothetical protein